MKLLLHHIAIFLLLANSLHSQSIHNNGQLISIESNALLSVGGDIHNQGIMFNKGTIQLAGDWLNKGHYDEASGSIVLTGADQNIDHNGQAFYNLFVNGAGHKYLASDLQIFGEMALENGIIHPSSHQLLLTDNADATGGSSRAYVDGPLYQAGNGYRFFPIGKAGKYRPLTLFEVTGIAPVIGFEVHEDNPYQRFSTAFKAVSTTIHWKKHHLSGEYYGSHVKLGFGEEDIASAEQIIIGAANQSEEIYTSLGSLHFAIGNEEVTSEKPFIANYLTIGVSSGFSENRTLYVPNVLSRSAFDPEDRVVKVYGESIDDRNFSFRIYNRWGNLIFETFSYQTARDIGWAGLSASGDAESNGVYKYVLQGQFESGTPFNKSGSISILN